VPLSAVVLAGGEPWCYVQTPDDVFVRRRVDLGRPLPQGYFQAQGFTAGERVVVAGAGLLLARIEHVKPGATRNFVIVDAAMNDLIRPALYGAWHEVRPVRQTEAAAAAAVYDVVGPVCESGDFLAKDRRLTPREGDLLALMSAGAYGMAMSSNYNSRPRPAEVLVSGAEVHLVRSRETVEQLFALERIPG